MLCWQIKIIKEIARSKADSVISLKKVEKEEIIEYFLRIIELGVENIKYNPPQNMHFRTNRHAKGTLEFQGCQMDD
jgi:hypothetical protein